MSRRPRRFLKARALVVTEGEVTEQIYIELLMQELRSRAGIRTRAKERIALNRTRELDTRLATGHALIRPYAVATVTVPKTVRAAEAGRRLDAAIRRAGFAPLRLDLAQDVGFAASTIPLGTSLLPGKQA